MATPSETITTVNGRRCTRSRARTATSTIISTTTSITSTSTTSTSTSTSTSTTTQDAQTVQSSAAAQAPPSSPPPPPVSSEAPSSTASSEAVSTATGTTSAVSSIAAQPTPAANISPQVPAAAVPAPVPDAAETPSAESAASNPTSTVSATSAPTSSDSTIVAVSPTGSDPAGLPSPSSTTLIPSSAAVLPEPAQSVSSEDPSPDTRPALSQPTGTGLPTGGSAGVISPDSGATNDSNGLTLNPNGQTDVASIAGGVIGGFVGLALISALLFFCLRRRKTGTFERWQRKISEKDQTEEGGFTARLHAVPDMVRGIPAGVGVLVAKLKGNKSGPASNPYRKHTRNTSSVYSVGTNRRSQSISEQPSRFRQQLRVLGGRMPSIKKTRALLQKKQDSLVIGQRSPFPGIVEDPVLRNSNAVENPFTDPQDQPNNLKLLNPDPASPQPQAKSRLSAPKPAATSERNSRDPFASIIDEINAQNGSGTPEWLRETAQQHKRTASAQTALRSNPPSTYTASIYTNAENPFFDPSDAPPVPTQPLPPTPSRPVNAYAPLPQFNATSSTVSRMSKDSFYFGEPGPSRPATNMYGRGVRQSDPFDLDRPEVLGFGNVGGRTVRASVTRQNSRKRSSTVPNWVNVNDGPYEPGSTPLRNPSSKRKPQRA